MSLTFYERQTIRKTITFYVCLYTSLSLLDVPSTKKSVMFSMVPTVFYRICVYTNTHRFPYAIVMYTHIVLRISFEDDIIIYSHRRICFETLCF